MALHFKSPRQENEYSQLITKNQPLYRLVNVLTEFVSLELGKDVLITEIYRTQAEFDALYAATPPGLRPKTSPHLVWHACDLRSTLYTQSEINRILAFLSAFRYIDGKPVGLYHEIAGNVFHFHVQYVGKDSGNVQTHYDCNDTLVCGS